MFGAGGGTNSYREVQDAETIVLWGSNARETHPIFFHHVLRAVRKGATLFVVDPRRTPTARFAHHHLAVRVGADITLANAVAHVILAEGLHHAEFLEHATTGLEAFRAHVADATPERAESITGVPAAQVRTLARAYARAPHAFLCWTLGITEHHNAVDNVLSLVNLALLTGQVGRWGAGLNPLRGQNNVQGGGDSGALPHKLPGFQDVEDPAVRAAFDRAWGVTMPEKKGWTLTEMFRAMERGDLRTLYVIGENPVDSEADAGHVRHLFDGLSGLIVQDIVCTRTADMAHVLLPASASWCESEGTVTNSERRVQRVRKAVDPPEGARDDVWIVHEIARRMGTDLGPTTAEGLWDELRSLSPLHRGMSYAQLEAHQGIQWPCPEEGHPGTPFLHARLWERPVRGPRAPLHCVSFDPPAERLSPEFPLRLTTGRTLDDYNTGVQTRAFDSPRRRRQTVDVSPADAARLGLSDGERVRVSTHRGSVEAPVRIDPGLLEGLVFMTLHAPDEVDTNLLTIEATDPKAGTAEFKAAAVRIERL